MDFLLLWIECTSLLLLWMALAVILEANLKPGLRKILGIIGLVGIAIASGFELVATLTVAIALKLSFTIFFVSSVAAVFVAGSAWLAWHGLHREKEGLASRAAAWPWRRIALLLAFATGLCAVTMHDMRIQADQEITRAVAELRELQHELNPPAPPALSAEPIFALAWPHLVSLDAVPGARDAFDQLENGPAPTAAQILAAPLADWARKNELALPSLEEGARRPLYFSLESSLIMSNPFAAGGRRGKIIELELNDRRPDKRVLGHLAQMLRGVHVVYVDALRDAVQGKHAQAVEEMNTAFSIQRLTGGGDAESWLEKLLAQPGFTDDELARLNLRATTPVKTRLQLALLEGETGELEFLLRLEFEPNGFTGPNPQQPFSGKVATDLLELGRSLIAVLSTHQLLARTQASYDLLWDAVYAPPVERMRRLQDEQLMARGFWGFRLGLGTSFILKREAHRACAEVGVAVARFRARTGHAPQSLSELAPATLLELPTDPFDGKPLRYRLEAGHALIYSVGPNLIDEQGAPLEEDLRDNGERGDIAFRVAL